MKPEVLVQQQFDAAKVAWKAEKVALQAQLAAAREGAVSEVLKAKPVPPGVSPEQVKALEARIQELTDENSRLKEDAKPQGTAKKAAKKTAKK